MSQTKVVEPVLYVALVNDGYLFRLFAVTKETPTRVYGSEIGRYSNGRPTFKSRGRVLMAPATEQDLARCVSVKAEYDRRRMDATTWYRKRLAEIAGKSETATDTQP